MLLVTADHIKLLTDSSNIHRSVSQNLHWHCEFSIKHLFFLIVAKAFNDNTILQGKSNTDRQKRKNKKVLIFFWINILVGEYALQNIGSALLKRRPTNYEELRISFSWKNHEIVLHCYSKTRNRYYDHRFKH